MTQGRDIKSEGISEAMVLKATRLDEITKGVNVDPEEFKVGAQRHDNVHRSGRSGGARKGGEETGGEPGED